MLWSVASGRRYGCLLTVTTTTHTCRLYLVITDGPSAMAPRAVTRQRNSRSAVTTARCDVLVRATTSTIASSPDPSASTTVTDAVEAIPRARPSTTRTMCTGPSNPATPESAISASRSLSRLVAPRRSRHHPSGTEPTTLAASTTRTGCRSPRSEGLPSRSPGGMTHTLTTARAGQAGSHRDRRSIGDCGMTHHSATVET